MKPRVARHVAELPKSGIRKFFDIVAQSKDVVSLGVGEPDFDTPWHISRAAVTCLENGGTHYTSNLGTPALRQAICRYLERRFAARYDWTKEVLATVGVSEAIDLAIRALCAPGDEVLYHEPCFVSYAAAIRLAHAVPVAVETRVEDEFRLTVEALEKKVTPRTKALLLNFPCNPTGATLSLAQMEEILRFCERHDIILLADEVYSELNYEIDDSVQEPQPLDSFAGFPEHRDRVVLLNGFSKSWAMTGYRLGYACGPEDIIDAMMKIHQYGIMSAPTLSQAAGVEAMDFGDKDVARMRREYKKRRDWLVPALNDMGLPTLMPKGAFYLFPDVRRTGLSSEEFCMKLLKDYKVACVPGEAFGPCGEGFIRISYATALDKIKVASANMARMVKSLGAFAALAATLFFAGCGSSAPEVKALFTLDVHRTQNGAQQYAPYQELVRTKLYEWRTESVYAKAIAKYRQDFPMSRCADDEIVQLLNAARMEPAADSRVIELAVPSTDVFLAQCVANAYLDAIAESVDEENARRAAQVTAGLGAAVKRKRAEQDELAKKLLDLRFRRNPERLAAARDDTARACAKTIGDIQAIEKSNAVLSDRVKLAETVSAAPERTAELMGEFRKIPLLAPLAESYAKSAAEMAKLLSAYTENHPEVVAKRIALEENARRFVTALGRMRDSTRQELESGELKLGVLRSKVETLRADVEKKAAETAAANVELQKLQSEFDSGARALEDLILQENAALIEAEGNNETVRVIRRATRPETAAGRGKARLRALLGY